MTKYAICARAGSGSMLDIDEDKFKKLKQARRCLTAALAIEEKYELLLLNYSDLEDERQNVADRVILNSTKDLEYSGLFAIKLAFNRRVVNLLTSTRLYLDQKETYAKACCVPYYIEDKDKQKKEIKKKVKKYSSNEFDKDTDKFPYYKFMEALRNYVQHKGLSVHSISFGSHQGDEGLEPYVYCFTNKTNAIGLKAEVLQEMHDNDMDEVELIHATRIYVGSISKIHCKLRELIKDDSDKARCLIQESINEYENANGRNPAGLNVIKIASNGTSEEFQLLLEWDNIRLDLIKKNNELVNLDKRYISNSCL